MASRGDLPKGKTPPARACDMCRRKKIKCDASAPPCSSCQNFKTKCVFSSVERPRKTPRKSSKRVDELESRVNYMEALIRSTPLNTTPKSSLPDAHWISRRPEYVSSSPKIQGEMFPSSNNSSTLLASKHISIVPKSIVDSNDSMKPISECVNRKHGTFLLPTKDEALPRIRSYFSKFNSYFPLFHEVTFLQMVNARYVQKRADDVGWWAALNVVLAISQTFVDPGVSSSRTEHDTRAREYIHNVTEVIAELTQSEGDLLSIQSLVGIAVLFQGTPNPRPASALVAAAVRLSQNLGLHRQDSYQDLEADQILERTRVFWAVYILDKDFSLLLNQSPLLKEGDYDIQVPERYPIDATGCIFSSDYFTSINFFRLRQELSVVTGKIYEKLYSLTALKQDSDGRILAIRELDGMLQDWSKTLPKQFQSENIATFCPQEALIHMVILHLTFFHCLIAVHRISFQKKGWVKSVLIDSLDDQVGCPYRCFELCLEAARSSMKLIKLLPSGNFAYIWFLFHPYVSGLVILLASILQRPENDMAHEDLALVDSLLQLIAAISDESQGDLGRIRAFCLNLWERAKTAVGWINVVGEGLSRRRWLETPLEKNERTFAQFPSDKSTIGYGQAQISHDLSDNDTFLPSNMQEVGNTRLQRSDFTTDWIDRLLQDDLSHTSMHLGSRDLYALGSQNPQDEDQREDETLRADLIERQFTLLPEELSVVDNILSQT